jgi:heat shock protein HslJ
MSRLRSSRPVLVALAASAAAVLVVAACGSSSKSTSAGGTPLEGTNWVLTAGGQVTTLPSNVTANAVFAKGTVGGNSGCNTYSGPYTTSGSSLTIGPNLVSTQKACDEPVMAFEKVYLAALTATAKYKISGSTMTLEDKAGATTLTFKASVVADQIIGAWNVTAYYSGTAITSVLGGAKLTAVFDATTISGNSGCNTFSGSYTLSGSTIKIGPLASTKKACESAELSKQETDYLAALELATTATVTGSRLDLLRADGGIAVNYTKG